jgi:hypothetical protein
MASVSKKSIANCPLIVRLLYCRTQGPRFLLGLGPKQTLLIKQSMGRCNHGAGRGAVAMAIFAFHISTVAPQQAMVADKCVETSQQYGLDLGKRKSLLGNT